MPSFSQQITSSGQFVIAVKAFQISQNTEDIKQNAKDGVRYYALIDTGANRCAISDKVVTNLSLQPYGKSEVMTAGGNHTTLIYLIGIAIPVVQTEIRGEAQKDGKIIEQHVPISEFVQVFPQTKVTTFPDVGTDRGFDIILGMDLLAQFHITMYQGGIIISI